VSIGVERIRESGPSDAPEGGGKNPHSYIALKVKKKPTRGPRQGTDTITEECRVLPPRKGGVKILMRQVKQRRETATTIEPEEAVWKEGWKKTNFERIAMREKCKEVG